MWISWRQTDLINGHRLYICDELAEMENRGSQQRWKGVNSNRRAAWEYCYWHVSETNEVVLCCSRSFLFPDASFLTFTYIKFIKRDSLTISIFMHGSISSVLANIMQVCLYMCTWRSTLLDCKGGRAQKPLFGKQNTKGKSMELIALGNTHFSVRASKLCANMKGESSND